MKSVTTQQTKYPTKEEILEYPYEISDATYKIIRQWKKEYFDGHWATISEEEKFLALNELIAAICFSMDDYPKPMFEVRQMGWCYIPGEFEVGLIIGETGRPSINSALHELGHHLLGKSELEACRFSISIFMKCFPNSYKKLVWDGHMLKKPDDKS